jgi:arginase
MVWIDAHGDCNTPETTLSGMLSGMPVAIALGLCLVRIRQQSGLNSPVDSRDVMMSLWLAFARTIPLKRS